MALTLQTPLYAIVSSSSSPASSSSSSTRSLSFLRSTPPPTLLFNLKNNSFPRIRASSTDTVITELDAVSSFSEIVPDTVIFDDFQKFPPTAATVSSSLILGICGLPDTIFRNAVEMALADSKCYGLEDNARLSCFATKALVNVGSDMTKLVPGRVSTEVDARLAYDTHGIIRKVHDLLKLYNDSNVPHDRLLFKIPSTWQGIEAARLLESEGIQTHLTFVYRVDYIIAPLKVLQSLKESVASPDEKYSFVRRLSPQSAGRYVFSDEELIKWDQMSLANAMGPAAVQLLTSGLDGYADQAKRVEDLFGKIWPPPNV
ncbi:hypothetical protein TSUD_183760 [Trifolium subterraneum]|uniref:Transaldolase n=1 Tax=Trifolium subterraneum TaxID=3900 RepID=A0A2Z6LVW4_TRISU|nr:hypothetical protein TSUD_183760 [Trifolium subterraneum]